VARTIVSCLGLGLAAAAATAGVAGLGASTSPEVVAAAATLGGVAGNFLTELLKVLHRPVAERLFIGQSGIDENHHVVAALRLAQLSTLRVVLGRFDTVWPSDRDDARHQAAKRFSRALKTFLDTETASAEKADFDTGPEQATDERYIRDAVLSKLPDVFDQSLAARRAAGNNAALLESVAQLAVRWKGPFWQKFVCAPPHSTRVCPQRSSGCLKAAAPPIPGLICLFEMLRFG
jgi:hypothetical protein